MHLELLPGSACQWPEDPERWVIRPAHGQFTGSNRIGNSILVPRGRQARLCLLFSGLKDCLQRALNGLKTDLGSDGSLDLDFRTFR